jgi:hypothetical protein
MASIGLILLWVARVLVGATAGFLAGWAHWKLGFELVGSVVAFVGAGVGGIFAYFGVFAWYDRRSGWQPNREEVGGMDDLIVGAVAHALGLVVGFMGLQVFMVTLQIWGFIAGFFVGAAGWEALVGDGLLRTVTGWIIEISVGLVFALLSYFFWYTGATIASASTGALLGSGLMAALDVDSDWIVFTPSATGAVIVAIIAIMLVLPAFIVLVNTAILSSWRVSSTRSCRTSRRPILTAGNSNGDIAMLQWAGGADRPGLRLLVLHDDPAREFDYVTGAGKALAKAKTDGRSVEKMKNDWITVFADEA